MMTRALHYVNKSATWRHNQCVFGFLLIEISSRKAVPEVTSTFIGPLHEQIVPCPQIRAEQIEN